MHYVGPKHSFIDEHSLTFMPEIINIGFYLLYLLLPNVSRKFILCSHKSTTYCLFTIELTQLYLVHGRLFDFFSSRMFLHFLTQNLIRFCLQEENLSSMNTDPWYSAYHYSHPPLAERLAAIDRDKED